MSDLQSKLDAIKGNESFLEKIKRYIPGYDGYVNRDNSRELDTQLRNILAMKLDMNKMKLKNTILNLSSKGKLFETGGIEKLDKKNEEAIAKLKSAARGYSGAFDINKIKEEKLSELYRFDSELTDDVENLVKQFADLEHTSAGDGDVSESVKAVSAVLDDFLKKFDERESLLRAS